MIGAAIGFGVGAALGAIGGAHNHTPVRDGVILGGSLFALIGGAIGACHVSVRASQANLSAILD